MSFPNCFLDSFAHYGTPDLLGTGNGQKWTGAAGTTSGLAVSPGTGLFGPSLRMVITQSGSQTSYVYKTLSALSTWVIGFRWRTSQIPTSGSLTLVGLYDNSAAALQDELRINTSGNIVWTRNGTTVATSTNAISVNTWYYIEWMCAISASTSANTCQVQVNGATTNWINLPAASNTKSTSNSTATTVYLGVFASISGITPGTMDFCDLYIDGGGAVNGGAFWGDTKVECHWPTAAGNYTAWAANGGTAVGCVADESPNGDTNFLSDNTTGDISSFKMTPLGSTPSSIIAVQAVHCSRKADAGTRQIADFCRSGTTDSPGTTVNLGNSYQYWTNVLTQDPATSAAWTATGLNAAEFGVKEIS